MPQDNHILFLPGFTIVKATQGMPLVIEAAYKRKARCPHCDNKRLRIKDTFFRQVRHESVGIRRCYIRFKAHKFYCYACKRYFNERFPGILKYQRATERLKTQVFHQHTQGVSQRDIAKHLDAGKSTVERWYQQHYHIQASHKQSLVWPKVLGVDEHFFTKKQRFATTFCDLKNHRIFDIVKGKSASDLAPFLNQIPGKERVKVACIDLSVTYRNIIKKNFPNALIVSDRFHVIRLVEHAFMKTCHSINIQMKYQRGVLAMLRTTPEKLSSHKRFKLDLFLQQNPAVHSLYLFKQELLALFRLKHQNARQCKTVIPVLLEKIQELKKTAFEPLMKLGRTLYTWREEIVRMWRFTKNNGITEGFHRKMKLIQRRAYGFRNFENYRLRVKVLCS
jgi:transposase